MRIQKKWEENFPGTARTDRLSAGVSYIWADTDTEKERERERERGGDKNRVRCGYNGVRRVPLRM
jgi:hypothetical protein